MYQSSTPSAPYVRKRRCSLTHYTIANAHCQYIFARIFFENFKNISNWEIKSYCFVYTYVKTGTCCSANKRSTDTPPRPAGERSSPNSGFAGAAPQLCCGAPGAVVYLCCRMWKNQTRAEENVKRFPQPHPVLLGNPEFHSPCSARQCKKPNPSHLPYPAIPNALSGT
jgi:hypothetical protein